MTVGVVPVTVGVVPVTVGVVPVTVGVVPVTVGVVPVTVGVVPVTVTEAIMRLPLRLSVLALKWPPDSVVQSKSSLHFMARSLHQAVGPWCVWGAGKRLSAV